MGMSVEIQKRLAESKAYNRWIYENIAPFTGRRVLDVGCSIGNITKFFLDRELVVGLDSCGEAIDIISDSLSGHSNFKAFRLDISDEKVRTLAGEGIDTILCLNVLEHVKDDATALASMHSILKADGRLIILVPVIKRLFGAMDEAGSHFRRYSKSELDEKLAAADFYVEKQFYMNLAGIACWYIDGKILKKKLIPMSHYSLYDKIVPFIAGIEGFVRPPIGLSLVTVCRKK